MIVLDPGHIYQLDDGQILKFVKRGGGAIQYPEEWPGIQTQAVMRVIITHLEYIHRCDEGLQTYQLWQLGNPDYFELTLIDTTHCHDIVNVLIDRSVYLNNILHCVETRDAVAYLEDAISMIKSPFLLSDAADYIRHALWSYEARAYRRKQEKVNREEPAHDDSQRLKAWRDHPAADVPFGPYEIERRPIGPDGHIVLET